MSNVSLPAIEPGTLAVRQLLQLLDGTMPDPVLLSPTLTPRGSASRHESRS